MHILNSPAEHHWLHDSGGTQASSQTGDVELGRDPNTGEVFFALDRSEADPRKIEFDSTQSYRIVLGRGSGLDGLETIEVDEKLEAELYRRFEDGWETCRVNLTIDEWGAISDSIDKHNLYSLDRAYHANVADGTQWILWIIQNGVSKTVYCNNYFPPSLRSFAQDVDSVFDIDDDLLDWSDVPVDRMGEHDERVWNAIRGK